jgi:RNA polymerase primary sigma factor
VRELARQVTSLERPVGEAGEAELGDVLPGEEPAPSEEIELALTQQAVRAVVSELPERQRTVIQMRFGLNGDRDPVSIRETARRLDMRPAEIRRVEQHALEELALRRELAALREAA